MRRYALAIAVLAVSWNIASAAVMSGEFGDIPAYLRGDKPAPSAPGTDIVEFRDGLAALARGDLDAAANYFHSAVLSAPRAPGPHIGLAEVAIRRGDTVAAENELHQALALGPNTAFVHSAWAHYLATQHKYSAAIEELGKAAALAPQWSAPYGEQGDIYLNSLHDPEKAADAYRSALAIDPKNADAHYALGIALMETGKLKDAKGELLEATTLAPKRPLSWAALGQAEAGLGEDDAALLAFDTALKIVPDLKAALIGRGDVLARKGQAHLAITAYKSALAADPRSVPALLRLAAEEEKEKRLGDAEKYYRAALEVDPENPVINNNLAFLLAEEKQHLDDALKFATEAANRNPHSSTALDTLAWVHQARGELAAAEKILGPLAADTKDPMILYHLGIVYSGMGKPQDAILAFDRSLKLAPDFPPARKARNALMMQSKR